MFMMRLGRPRFSKGAIKRTYVDRLPKVHCKRLESSKPLRTTICSATKQRTRKMWARRARLRNSKLRVRARYRGRARDEGMRALILAGGLGTRLRSLLNDRPKPMAQVAGKPFLEYQIEMLRAHGFEDLVLCVGYLARHVQDYFGDGRDWGVRIDYAVETELLGTAGAIKNAQTFIAEDAFLVLNGDSYLEADLRGLAGFHQNWRSADPQTVASVAVVATDDTSAYGKVELDERARLLHFGEKAEASPGWINGGVYVLEPAVLDSIPVGAAVSLEKETFPLILEQNHHVFGYPVGGFFVDIGTPEGYRRFCRYVEEKQEAS